MLDTIDMITIGKEAPAFGVEQYGGDVRDAGGLRRVKFDSDYLVVAFPDGIRVNGPLKCDVHLLFLTGKGGSSGTK